MPVPKHRVFNKFPDDPNLSSTAREALDSMLAQINTLMGQGSAPTATGASAPQPFTLNSPTISTPVGNCTYLLNAQGTLPALLGTGSNQTVYSFIIPGGTLRTNTILHVYTYITRQLGSGNLPLSINFGNTGNTSIVVQNSNRTGSPQTMEARIYMLNQTTQQTVGIISSSSGGVAQFDGPSSVTTSANIASATQITLQFAGAVTESIIPKFWQVMLEQ